MPPPRLAIRGAIGSKLMSLTTPMTLIISFALLVCLAVGLAILFRSVASRRAPRGTPSVNEAAEGKDCPRCHNANPPEARFCARCGTELTT